MSFRAVLIVAVILVLLGAYAYFIEYKGSLKKELEEEKQKTLMEIKKEDVAEIRIEGLGQPVRIVPVTNEKWRLTAPIQTPADETTVSRIVGDFEKLKYRSIAEEQPKDLSQYGLDQPRMTVHFVLKKGGPEQTVMVGAKNPVDNVYYVRVNKDPRVYIAEGAGDITSTTLFDLRDKKLTDFTAEKVESLSLRTSKLDLQFKKTSGVWKMIKPLESPASDSEVSSLLSSLEFLRASQFIDQPAADLAEFGLKEPTAVVELLLEKGLQQKIHFGSKTAEQYYCRIEGSPGLALVSDSFSTYFDKDLDGWREKKVLVFNRFDAAEVRVKSGGKEYLFTKDKEDKWIEKTPEKGEVDGEKIQDLLEKIENAEITQYGEKPALDGTPLTEVFMTLKDWQDKVTKKHMAFGALKENLLPVKNDDYGTIVFTDPMLPQQLEKALSEIKPKPKK